ncbi:MAG TPA: hypothetical protein VKD66_15195 [Streptosporangiaceae bacterium]|nr:hypothetical protein [Streptosporangiaceae bacterium]
MSGLHRRPRPLSERQARKLEPLMDRVRAMSPEQQEALLRWMQDNPPRRLRLRVIPGRSR